MNDQCHVIVRTMQERVSSSNLDLQKLEIECKKLQEMMAALPLQSDVDKVSNNPLFFCQFLVLLTILEAIPNHFDNWLLQDILGNELESEMARMTEAIRAAVEEIEKIQEKARNNNEGIR